MADRAGVTSPGETVYRLAIVAPTCFYYQSALFRALASHPRIDLTVYFCSDEPLRGADVLRTFNTDHDWGLEEDLLAGYKYKFLRNYSPRPSYLGWPHGLMNFGIWNQLRKGRPHAVVLMSWTNLTWWLAILACVFYTIPYFYMTDANVLSELPKRRLWRWLKMVWSPWASSFLGMPVDFYAPVLRINDYTNPTACLMKSSFPSSILVATNHCCNVSAH